jgi:hypothetical protein
MSIREYLMKACQDDARRAGERDRLLLEARRASPTRDARTSPTTPVRRIAALLLLRVAKRMPACAATGCARSISRSPEFHAGARGEFLDAAAAREPAREPACVLGAADEGLAGERAGSR